MDVSDEVYEDILNWKTTPQKMAEKIMDAIYKVVKEVTK